MDTATLPLKQPEVDAGEGRSREVLDFIHGLLLSSDQPAPSLASLLTELAKSFGALEAGLALGSGSAGLKAHVDVDGRPVTSRRYPWEESPAEREEAARTVTANRSRGQDQTSWLWTGVETSGNCSWTFWVADSDERSWTDLEAAALPLAGQAIARRVEAGGGPPGLARAFERARLQGNLEGAARLTSRLAHDFGNVLTGILGFSELSLTQLPAESLPRRYVDEILQSAQQGARWVQKLQWFGRRRSQPFVPASLAAVLAQEAARVQPAWQGKVELKITLPEALPGVALEAEALREALAQLLDNAREAIAGQGIVSLSVRATELNDQDCQELLGNAVPGPHVELTIADSGAGFDPEARRRLFVEPFFSNKPRHRGLGLAVVYGILQTFRGGLRFGPEQGQGTTVRVLLPVTAAAEPARPASGPDPLPGARILVVDDDKLTVRFVGSVLETLGCQIQSARSAAEAFELYASGRRFDLVLSDIVMPQGDGFDLVRQLLAFEPRPNVLFMSCRQDGQDWPQDEGLKDCDLLRKPFRPEGLVRAVRTALQRGRSGRPADSP